jgi:hypothetical protein
MKDEDFTAIVNDPANNITTVKTFTVFAHPKKDMQVHVLVGLIHEESGLNYRQLMRMPATTARKLSDDLQRWADLVGTPGPNF